MLRRIIGITGISLWAGLIAVVVLAGFGGKANGEPMFENLPEGWRVEKSFAVPRDQTGAISRRLGGRISRLTNTVLSIEGQHLQVNVLYCPTEKEAEKVYKAVLEAHDGLAVTAARDGKLVVEFAKSDDVDLMNRARRGLGLPDSRLDSIAGKLIKKIPDGWEIKKSFIASREQTAAVGKKLGGRIKNLSNTIFTVDGREFQVNVIECATPPAAEAIYNSILGMKDDPAFCLRFGNLVVEFVGNDVELAKKAPYELGFEMETKDTMGQTDLLDINSKVAKLNIKTATFDDVIRIFGEPFEYIWGNQTFTKDDLPSTYILRYPNGFNVLISGGRVRELRHHEPGYMFRGKLQVGSSLDEVLKIIGRPKKTSIAVAKPKLFEDGVLYKDINGEEGYCYYARERSGVRFFFGDYKVTGLYVTRNDLSGRRRSRDVRTGSGTKSPAIGVDVLARDFIQLLAGGDFSKATENFDAAMNKAAPPEQLNQIWNSLIESHGPFKQILASRKEKFNQFDFVFVSCEFEKGVVDLKVVFSPAKQIAGFFIARIEPATSLELPAYVKPDFFSEKEVQIGTGQWVLPGTLTLPKGSGPFPAVVLVHGSGPHDRDETVGANKPFRDLAWGLATWGIAVLRYDKRTKALPLQMALIMSTLTVKEETIDDALTAVALLRETEKIDTDKIFVLGHSLGGTVIPRIGKNDAKIAGFIVMAGSVRPLEDVIIDQFSYIFSADGVISEDEKMQLEKLKQQAARVKDPNLSSDTPATELPLGIVPASYWLDLRGYNPAEMARELTRPMLILQGGRDYQVTEADFQLWKKSLSSRNNVEFRHYPKLNHLFIEGEGKSTPDEYRVSGHIAPNVINTIAYWIKNL